MAQTRMREAPRLVRMLIGYNQAVSSSMTISGTRNGPTSMPPRRASGAKCDQERELAKPGVLQALAVE
jgi:hypothetical protein